MKLAESIIERARRTVLVVDDEPVVLDLLEELLGEFDFTVLRADNARDARKIITSTPFAVAILDKNMPDLSGMQLLREIKEDAPLSQVLILTGYVSVESAIDAVRNQAFDYVPKPFEAADLIAKVEAAATEFAKQVELEGELTRHESLFESIPGLVWFVAEEGRLVRINRTGAQALGYSVGELEGQTYKVLLEEGTKDKWAFTERRTAPRAAVAKRVTLRSKAGELRTFEVHSAGTYTELELEDGNKRQFAGTVGVATDITDQLRMEQALQQIQKMESLGSLAGGVAHDFNNLLTIIEACVEILGREPLSEAAEAGLQDLDLACQRATSLSKQLLTFSHQRSQNVEDIDVASALRASNSMLRRLVRENIQLEVRLHRKDCFVSLPPAALEQMLLNLIANARDAMPGGGSITVEVDLKEVGRGTPGLSAGDYVEIQVGDTGVGMDEETRKRALEPFFTTKKPGDGTGLGLATVYGLAANHGGTVVIESESGQGTKVTILLPAATRALEPRQVTDVPEDLTAEELSPTVLLVEDDDLVRRSTESILKRAGLTILSAADGEKGLEQFAANKDAIGVLLTDVVMPGISGRVLARRALEVVPDLQVIFVSGYAPDDDDADVPGVFVAKPYPPQKLVSEVHKALARWAAITAQKSR
ncbi:MAG: response regulator [Deltaproteobacteria bacterium]|nr:response regulator [Deltaproteobacteria bacterium]